MKVTCLVLQEHNTVTRPGFEPGPIDIESDALYIMPLRLLHIFTKTNVKGTGGN